MSFVIQVRLPFKMLLCEPVAITKKLVTCMCASLLWSAIRTGFEQSILPRVDKSFEILNHQSLVRWLYNVPDSWC